jgi:preprotein translocase subunit SecE
MGASWPGASFIFYEAGNMAKTTPVEFLRQVRAETGKVVWPTREETVKTSIFVGILMVLLSVFFLGIDSLFGAAVRWLLSLV